MTERAYTKFKLGLSIIPPRSSSVESHSQEFGEMTPAVNNWVENLAKQSAPEAYRKSSQELMRNQSIEARYIIETAPVTVNELNGLVKGFLKSQSESFNKLPDAFGQYSIHLDSIHIEPMEEFCFLHQCYAMLTQQSQSIEEKQNNSKTPKHDGKISQKSLLRYFPFHGKDVNKYGIVHYASDTFNSTEIAVGQCSIKEDIIGKEFEMFIYQCLQEKLYCLYAKQSSKFLFDRKAIAQKLMDTLQPNGAPNQVRLLFNPLFEFSNTLFNPDLVLVVDQSTVSIVEMKVHNSDEEIVKVKDFVQLLAYYHGIRNILRDSNSLKEYKVQVKAYLLILYCKKTSSRIVLKKLGTNNYENLNPLESPLKLFSKEPLNFDTLMKTCEAKETLEKHKITEKMSGKESVVKFKVPILGMKAHEIFKGKLAKKIDPEIELKVEDVLRFQLSHDFWSDSDADVVEYSLYYYLSICQKQGDRDAVGNTEEEKEKPGVEEVKPGGEENQPKQTPKANSILLGSLYRGPRGGVYLVKPNNKLTYAIPSSKY